jgi:hypothetical protein
MQESQLQVSDAQTVPLLLAVVVFVAIIVAAGLGGFFVGHMGSLPPTHAFVPAALL